MSKDAAEKNFTGKPKAPMTDSKDAKSSITSPNFRPGFVKILGGMPPEKDVKEIDKVNEPEGRKRAPGSTRV